METATIIAILELAAKYGIPAVTASINEMNKSTITDEDIKNLATLIKKPEDY